MGVLVSTPSGGFTVRLGALESYEQAIKGLVENYDTIISGLDQSVLDDSKKRSLVANPEELISSGGAVEFADSCRTLIDNYATLMDTLQKLHVAIRNQFGRAQQVIGESRATYARLDDRHALVFEGLLGGRTSGEEG
ncbi:MAG: hypothetical protein ACRDSK_11725 [Actinophytocola sp.]|uniref:hypothetical protein n=1 Tax=Actinophytocola sp. TaxID=1872138 RepID=UPI003D6A0253